MKKGSRVVAYSARPSLPRAAGQLLLRPAPSLESQVLTMDGLVHFLTPLTA